MPTAPAPGQPAAAAAVVHVPAQPAWLPASPTPAQQTWTLPAAPPQPHAAAVAPPSPDLTRSYAEWFDWACSQFTDDHLAHVATEAAVAALRSGADPTAAVAAGQQATVAPGARSTVITADKPTLAYAAWFVWARQKIGLDPQRAHLAAATGRSSQAAGAAVPIAQQHALAAAGVGPAFVPQNSTRAVVGGSALAGLGGISWRDPGQRAIVFGIVALVVPFVFNIYFLLLPIIGLVYSLRALTQSRLALGIVGVVLNGLATLLTAALFFRLI